MADIAPATTGRSPLGYWSLVWGQFRQNRPALLSAAIILFLFWLAAWGPVLANGRPWIWTVWNESSHATETTYPLISWLVAPSSTFSVDYLFNYFLFLSLSLPLIALPAHVYLKRRKTPAKRYLRLMGLAAVLAAALAVLPFVGPGSYESTGGAIAESLTAAREWDAICFTWGLRLLLAVVLFALLPFFRRNLEWSFFPSLCASVIALAVLLATSFAASQLVCALYGWSREGALVALTGIALVLTACLYLLHRRRNAELFWSATLLAMPFLLLGILAPVRLFLGPWYTVLATSTEVASRVPNAPVYSWAPTIETPPLSAGGTPTHVRNYHLFQRFRLDTTPYSTRRLELDPQRSESALFTIFSQDPISPSAERLHSIGTYHYFSKKLYRVENPDVITVPNLKNVKRVCFQAELEAVDGLVVRLKGLPTSFPFQEKSPDGKSVSARDIPCSVVFADAKAAKDAAAMINSRVWVFGEHKPDFDAQGKLLGVQLSVTGLQPASVELPSVHHWLGTDRDGRDVLARMIHGARISISVGFVAVGLNLLIGILLGGLAGYYRGWVDILISRFIELMICFPTFFLILTIIAFMEERSIFHVMLVMGLTGWSGIARLVRGEFLKLAEQDFVHAARALGCSGQRVMFRHMLPNALGPVLVSAAFGIAGAVLTESGLAFLGFGAPPPTPTWGEMIRQGYDHVTQGVWWLFLFPGFSIFLTVTVYNEAGDGLRDAMDPRLRK